MDARYQLYGMTVPTSNISNALWILHVNRFVFFLYLCTVTSFSYICVSSSSLSSSSLSSSLIHFQWIGCNCRLKWVNSIKINWNILYLLIVFNDFSESGIAACNSMSLTMPFALLLYSYSVQFLYTLINDKMNTFSDFLGHLNAVRITFYILLVAFWIASRCHSKN